MPNQSINLDRIFHALSDPTRRAVLAKLCDAPASATELARPFEMALPSFLQHLNMLESCGLVSSQKAGRVRSYRIEPAPLKEAMHWLERQREHWEARLDRFDAYVLSLKETE